MPSTVIRKAAYNEAAHLLRIQFVSGGLYEYLDVPRTVYEAFRSAMSKGRFFAEHIRNNYACRKLEPEA